MLYCRLPLAWVIIHTKGAHFIMSEPLATGTLLEKTAGGAGWTIGWRAATRALGFISTLVLARILVPADFGLVALAMSFARAIDILADLGVEDAVVRAASPSRAYYDTAFTINALRGLTTATVVGVSAMPFAIFFGDPRLTYVRTCAGSRGLARRVREYWHCRLPPKFQFPQRVSALPLSANGTGPGYHFSCIDLGQLLGVGGGILTARVLRITASYIMHPYRPHLSLRAWRELIGFSFWTWMISMAQMIRGRGVTMIIGRMLNPTLLGVYTLGSEIATLPETELIAPLCRVCFASFSAARRDGMRIAETYLRIISSTLVIALPASIGISSIAAPLVTLAFGSKWMQATPVVQILALAGLFAVMGRISWTLFSAFAYLRSLFWISIVMALVSSACSWLSFGNGDPRSGDRNCTDGAVGTGYLFHPGVARIRYLAVGHCCSEFGAACWRRPRWRRLCVSRDLAGRLVRQCPHQSPPSFLPPAAWEQPCIRLCWLLSGWHAADRKGRKWMFWVCSGRPGAACFGALAAGLVPLRTVGSR